MGGSSPSPLVMACGTEEPPAPIRRLAVGPLSFDLEAGKLRYIRLGGVEVLRSIAFVVRGPAWETLAPAISQLEVVDGERELQAAWHALYKFGTGQIEVIASVSAAATGRLSFEAEVHALTDFSTARTSFCILHPLAGVAGRALWVTHPDESVEAATFPDAISARQPFMNIRALSHQVGDGLRATVRMEGDVWEMEDQRNWSDASFKTYGRPLDLPRPYTIAGDQRLRQSATLTFEGAAPQAGAAASTVEVRIGAAGAGRLPDLGLAVSPDEAAPALAAAEAARITPRRLVCWFKLGEQGPADLAAYGRLAARLSAEVALELVLPCAAPPGQEMAEAARLLADSGLTPGSITPIQAPLTKWVRVTPEALGLPGFAEIYAAARAAFPGVAIGAGVLSNFTELNLDRPPLAGADYVTHCTAAVVHEPDDRSVMETLETLPHIFASTRRLAGDLPYRLGPSAIGMRYNPYGAGTEPNEANIRIAFAHQDPRQRGLFGAAFALGYVARAAAAGLDSVCFGALTGPFGLVHRRMPYPQPWFDGQGFDGQGFDGQGLDGQGFDGQAGALVYPAYHVVAALAEARGAALRPVQSSDEKRLLGLAWQRPDGKTEIWLANLTAEPQTARLAGLAGPLGIRRLDAASFERAARDPRGFRDALETADAAEPLPLGPYAVARLVARA